MQPKIFFCGEVVADLVEYEAGTGAFTLKLGGSQYHGAMGAACAHARTGLGCDIYFVAPVSRDDFGERFIKSLRAAQVDTSLVTRVERNTTLAIVALRSGQENSFAFYGRDTAEQMTQPQELPEQLPAGSDKICVFGSISTVMEPARFTWQAFAAKQKADAVIYYDLNTRPAIAKDPVRYREIVSSWAATADIVKASSADIAWTYPGETPEMIAEHWFKAGATMAVFTLGEKGSLVITPNAKAASVPTEAVSVKNTIGAGDNFNAGFVLGLVRQGCASRTGLAKAAPEHLTAALHDANGAARTHLLAQAG